MSHDAALHALFGCNDPTVFAVQALSFTSEGPMGSTRYPITCASIGLDNAHIISTSMQTLVLTVNRCECGIWIPLHVVLHVVWSLWDRVEKPRNAWFFVVTATTEKGPKCGLSP